MTLSHDLAHNSRFKKAFDSRLAFIVHRDKLIKVQVRAFTINIRAHVQPPRLYSEIAS